MYVVECYSVGDVFGGLSERDPCTDRPLCGARGMWAIGSDTTGDRPGLRRFGSYMAPVPVCATRKGPATDVLPRTQHLSATTYT